MSVLYLTWDGPHNAYLESLFMPILARIGRPVTVLQLSYGDEGEAARAAVAADEHGIGYTRVAVPRWTSTAASTAAGVAIGVRALRRELRKQPCDVVIARSVIPALVVLEAKPKIPFVYDGDGLVQDERVEFLGWSPTGAPYRILRDVELRALHRAVAVVTRTEATKRILLARAGPYDESKIRVVPNGKDPTAFAPCSASARGAFRKQHDLPAAGPLVVYCGSLGAQYEPHALLTFFGAVRGRRSDAHLLVLTGHEAAADKAVTAAGLPPSDVTVRRVAPDEVPGYLAAADVGVAFRTPSFSQQAVCPIKVGEYLLCGLPVVANAGVGDLDTQLADCAGAFVGERLDEATTEAMAHWFIDEIYTHEGPRRAARERGIQHFSLDRAAEGYRLAVEAARIVTRPV